MICNTHNVRTGNVTAMYAYMTTHKTKPISFVWSYAAYIPTHTVVVVDTIIQSICHDINLYDM